ncbi:hypothetical protein [Pyxidicoccus sp. MSG2]|uniref:hypothetical protein n=1 Tax=Pyxidicoccus sp. MSG2 TaxID=2996790 RepID=UPI002270B0D5|nr:hypothetical protein [Pyxidicoccus sp. MSG2]MCY1020216.1 hypothetical protein [Pyxidicoccus sp. MSG2]
MKKTLVTFVAAIAVAGFGASVHAAAYGGGFVKTYGGGTPTNPNPTFHGNCTATLQQFAVGGDGGPDYKTVINWTTVSASTPGECNSIVNSYLNSNSGGFWLLSPYTPRCACSSPGMARAIALGDTLSWTQAQDDAMSAELAELKEEYRVDEYYERVQQLVEERMQ